MNFSRLPRMKRFIDTQPAFKPVGLSCAVAVLWGFIEVLGGLIPARYSPYQTVWMRYGIHLLFLFMVWGPRRKAGLVRTPRWGAQILRGLLMLGMPATFILAIDRMPANTTWSIFWLAPLVSMAGAAALLKEKAPPAAWGASVFGLAGAWMILRPALSGGWQASLLALGMMLCFALYVLASRLLREENTFTSLFYTAAAVLLPLSAVVPTFWRPLSWKAAAVMGLIGLLGFGLLFALERALETAPVSASAPFLYTTPIWYMLFSATLHHTPIHTRDLAGALVILIPTVLLALFLAHGSRRLIPSSMTGQPRA